MKTSWRQSKGINKLKQRILADELLECVWPFCGVGAQG